ncbi:MAG: YlbF family regulator [Clostridia bacterium]|nr:YlbF family regulator [Clostridia bacterium]
MDNMNVYDKCQALSAAIKSSREYVEFKEIKEIVMQEPGLKEKIDEFEKIRYEEQLLAIQGEEQNIAKMQKLQDLYNILVNDPKVKEYFDKEVKFNLMVADINKMIGEAIKDVL